MAISIRISFDYWQVSPLNSLCLPFVVLMWVFSSLEHFPTLVFGFLLLSEASNLQESLGMLTNVWKYSFSICCLIFNFLTFIGDLFFVHVLSEFCDEINANPSLEFGPLWRVWHRVPYLTARGMQLICQETACFLSEGTDLGSMRTELPQRMVSWPAFPSPDSL